MAYKNHRGEVGRLLSVYSGTRASTKKLGGYEGKCINLFEGAYLESLPATVIAAIVHRGTEKDCEAIRTLARKWKAFSTFNMQVKLQVLNQGFDVPALFREFAPEELPTRNIHAVNGAMR